MIAYLPKQTYYLHTISSPAQVLTIPVNGGEQRRTSATPVAESSVVESSGSLRV